MKRLLPQRPAILRGWAVVEILRIRDTGRDVGVLAVRIRIPGTMKRFKGKYNAWGQVQCGSTRRWQKGWAECDLEACR